MKRLPRGSLIVAGAFSGTLSVAVPDHAVAQEGAPAGGSIKSGNESVELLRAEAERSERAVQAAIAAVHELSQVLQTEASQSAVATQRDSEAIRHAMDVFIWIVGAVSAILVAGAGILAWALSAWGKASKADIKKRSGHKRMRRSRKQLPLTNRDSMTCYRIILNRPKVTSQKLLANKQKF
jgi:hypothetical protein